MELNNETKEHNIYAEWIKNMKTNYMKKTGGENTPEFEKSNTQGNIGKLLAYLEYGFKKLFSIHDWLALQLNKGLQEASIPEWENRGKILCYWMTPEKYYLYHNGTD